jgi:hypothetical protein
MSVDPRAPFLVVDDFLPLELAQAMRLGIDDHFARPGAHGADTHQVWNYWFVPGLYTYLRTTPEKVIDRPLIDRFFTALKSWSIQRLGMAEITWPYLSLYVPGCRQALHNDSGNGRFGFVYSLTRDQRRTSGGETVIHREGDHFRANLRRPSAGSGFYDAIEPRFNRLVIFDDRLPHAVERIDGSMDPVEGRFVLHGHLREAGGIVDGALPPEALTQPFLGPIQDAIARDAARLRLYHGPMALRLTVGANGSVEDCRVLMDRVIHPDPGDAEWEPWVERLIKRLRMSRFVAAEGPTVIIQPLIFGGALARG